MAEAPTPPSLEGITLEMMLNQLQGYYGWEELGRMIKIKCFLENPSLPSSLKFLRRTPWARSKVENLYRYFQRRTRKSKATARE